MRTEDAQSGEVIDLTEAVGRSELLAIRLLTRRNE